MVCSRTELGPPPPNTQNHMKKSLSAYLDEYLKHGIDPAWYDAYSVCVRTLEQWMPGKGWQVVPSVDMETNEYNYNITFISTEHKLGDEIQKQLALMQEKLKIPPYILTFRSGKERMTWLEFHSLVTDDVVSESKFRASKRRGSMSVDVMLDMLEQRDNATPGLESETPVVRSSGAYDLTSESHPAYHECIAFLRILTRAKVELPPVNESYAHVNSVGVVKFRIIHMIPANPARKIHPIFEIYEIDKVWISRIKFHVQVWCSMHYERDSFTWLAFSPAESAGAAFRFSFQEEPAGKIPSV